MPRLIVDLHIAPDEYQRWYRGGVQMVNALARDGRRVNFPASSLQRFVRHDGVHGSFAILFDDQFKLIGVERLE
ncbi:MAG: DUF2835 domain-containing protein [Pseudomonadota bacterium]